MGIFSLCALLAAATFSASADKPNVVFLSVDTLRADYLGCYGHPYDSSPNLDLFAKDSLLFEDCVCEVPLTLPSFGAMLASRYPRMTGTTRNGLRMPKSVPLAQEIFKAAGYQTLCVQSNWPLKGHLSGLDRGFDVYRDDFTKKRWGFMKGERDAKNVTDTVLELLNTRDANKPFFLWAHYSDPHAPYQFHKGFNPHGSRLNLDSHERVRAKYDSEVAYADHHIGRLLDALPKENTVIVFVADHGESLYEHNYLGHGRRIYHDNLHIPLIVRAPGIAPGRTPTPACALDIAPVLLALAGLQPAPGMLGHNLLAASPSTIRTRFVETYGGAVPKAPGMKALLAGRGPLRRGVLHEGWKLIRGGSGPELFYLPDDPHELNNLAEKAPERVDELTKLFEKWDRECPHGNSRKAELSTEDLEALRSLGYLE